MILRLASIGLLACSTAACGGDPRIVSVTANPSTIAAGGTITMTVVLENVDDVHSDEHALTARALVAADDEAHEEEEGVHIHTYLDSTDVNPLAQTSSTTYPVVVPAATAAGAHQLIVRLHNGDHTIITPEVKASVGVTVQ